MDSIILNSKKYVYSSFVRSCACRLVGRLMELLVGTSPELTGTLLPSWWWSLDGLSGPPLASPYRILLSFWPLCRLLSRSIDHFSRWRAGFGGICGSLSGCWLWFSRSYHRMGWWGDSGILLIALGAFLRVALSASLLIDQLIHIARAICKLPRHAHLLAFIENVNYL
jgi:hypothetical protein